MSRPTEPIVQVSDDLPGRRLPDASGANAGSADPVAKHTPGPWHISSFEPGAGGAQRVVMGADGYGVAWLMGRSEAEHDKDAHLIEAAPDLLQLAQEAWGALNFILAFYEPGQRYLDTNAWTQAEASGRRVHAALRGKLDSITKATAPQSAPSSAATGNSGMNNSNNSEA